MIIWVVQDSCIYFLVSHCHKSIECLAASRLCTSMLLCMVTIDVNNNYYINYSYDHCYRM